jgi:hypothetical protein
MKVLFLGLLLTSLIYAQDYDSYNDSILHADSLSLMARGIIVKVGTEECHPDSLAISVVTDSLEHCIDHLDSVWGTCRPLCSFYNQILKPDNLSWNNNYRLNALGQLTGRMQVEPYAVLLLTRINTEIAGTQFIISRECGLEQVKAHAHLKKLQQEASQVTELLASLNRNAEAKMNAVSCKGKIKLGR